MSSVLAIDPGVSYYAWAYGELGHIKQCGYVEGLDVKALPCAARLIVELPQVYNHGPVRTSDIRDLTLAAGQLIAGYSALRPGVATWTPQPSEWKGSVPKDIHQERIWSKMTDDERWVMCQLGDPKSVRSGKRAGHLAFTGRLGHAMDAGGMVLRFWRR